MYRRPKFKLCINCHLITEIILLKEKLSSGGIIFYLNGIPLAKHETIPLAIHFGIRARKHPSTTMYDICPVV
jgi:hypothetical protein